MISLQGKSWHVTIIQNIVQNSIIDPILWDEDKKYIKMSEEEDICGTKE